MSFEHFWTILIKRWSLIVICFMLVGIGAYIVSKLMTPLYRSASLVQVALASQYNLSAYDSLLASEQLVDTEAALATSDPVLRKVASHYQGMTVDQLSKEVTAASKLNTQLFEIDVVDPSPIRAAALANDVASTLAAQQYQLQRTQQSIVKSTLLIVQAAQPGLKPVQPNTLLNTIAGLLAGLSLGVLLAILFEQLDTRVRTPEAVAQLLDWPVLATIWQARSSKKEDVFNPTGNDNNVESYRILRTNLGFSGIDKPLHSLMISSAQRLDGKSIIAANLAIFMAKAGKTTLLIDADLHQPVQQDQFGLPADKMGLSNAILAMSTSTPVDSSSHLQLRSYSSSTVRSRAPIIEESLVPFIHAVDIPNLWVMPSGSLPPNPPELLDSKAMQSLLTVIASCDFEIVIFDAPPFLGLSDASILASKVDAMLIVVDITHANKGRLRQMKSLLTQTRTRVIGCVVNKQRPNHENTPYYSSSPLADMQNGGRKNGKLPAIVETPAIVEIPTVPINISHTAEVDPSESGKGESSEDGG